MVSTTSYRNIEPLTKSNYDTWSLQAQAVLIKNDYWDIVSGEKTLPTDADAAAKLAFNKEDLKARAEILLLLSPSELKQIKVCTTSKAVWDKLKATYQSTGPARKATLLKQLVLKRMNTEEDIRDHINNFMDIVDKLADMNIKIPPELLSIMLLYSLPTTFENFRIAIESRDTLPNPEDLKVKIMEEYQARSGGNQPSKSSEAYYTKKNKKNLYCKICKKKGHSVETCWHKKKNASEKDNGRNNSKNFNVCLSTVDSDSNENIWCLDSGCSSHMCGDKSMFSAITPKNGSIKLASKKYISEIKGKGRVTVSREQQNYNFNDTLYVPDLSTNLLSVGKITDRGHKVVFEQNKAYVVEKDGEVSLTAQRKNGLYYLELERKETAQYTPKVHSDIMEWHRKLGHINETDLKKMAKDGLMYGLNLSDEKLQTCETCIKGKLSRLPFTRHDNLYTTDKLEIIHSDVCGPFECESLAGSRYYVTFIDDFTRYCHVYFIKRKSDVFNIFKEYKNEVETLHARKIKYLQSDNGTEYRNKDFDDFLKSHGIQRRLTTFYTPQQNGISERKNRSLLEKARCLLIEANAPKKLWAEAVATANYLINRSPSKALNGDIPFKKWVGRTPCAHHLQVFGRKTFVLKKKKRGKFTQNAKEGVFMGYSMTSKSYRVYLPEDDAVVMSRDIKVINKMYFEEGQNYDKLIDERVQNSKMPKNKEVEPIEIEIIHDKNGITSQNQNNQEDDEDDESYEDAPEVIETPENVRPQRERRPPTWTKDFVLDEPEKGFSYSELSEEEYTYLSDVEFVSGTGKEWHEAIKSEMRSHVKNGTWIIKSKDKEKNLIDFKQILKDKGQRKKARLVARGFTQRPEIDYNETWAPENNQHYLTI